MSTGLSRAGSATGSWNRPLLHHSRYADCDRRILDGRVMDLIGVEGRRSGCIVVATQTCEQSLNIDAQGSRMRSLG